MFPSHADPANKGVGAVCYDHPHPTNGPRTAVHAHTRRFTTPSGAPNDGREGSRGYPVARRTFRSGRRSRPLRPRALIGRASRRSPRPRPSLRNTLEDHER